MTIATTIRRAAAGLAHAPLPPGLRRQEQERQRALRRLARLRNEASAEIERLIAFLDASDPYICTEVEEDFEQEQETGEPALGSCDQQVDQTRWSDGGADDCELDPADSGIGDQDGLLEQIGSQDWTQAVMA
ncbi:hypothetical protein [Bradyrhizobium yuanmingense]|uniref:hypothetical protein n=1 Tax=Bradyrhizobium yuanmingense TaxID=108015 RepID=UPI0023B9FE9D|nr:hypothetical protein [Bradyrhizobium yuanmingense]MDF0581273.1 hypothetical protein [Bradyrhizobium yuanmingense]